MRSPHESSGGRLWREVSCVASLLSLTIVLTTTITTVTAAAASSDQTSITPNTYLDAADKSRLKSLFLNAPTGESLSTAYYALLGLNELKVPVPDQQVQAACALFKEVDPSDIEQVFYATSIGKLVTGCKFSLTDAQKSSLQSSAVSEGIKTSTLYYAVNAMKNLNIKVDHSAVESRLSAAVKSDDSAGSLSHAFHVASQFVGTPQASKAEAYHVRIEDVVQQADEVDSKYIQFEGGVSATSFTVTGIFSLCTALNKPPVEGSLPPAALIKLTTYLLSRKHVQVVKSAARLLQALTTLDTNKFHIPVTVTLVSPLAVFSPAQPLVQVRVSRVLGGEIQAPGGTAPHALTVTADRATRQRDSATVLSKVTLKQSAANDKTVYEMNMMDSKPSPGFYNIQISVNTKKPDPRLVGLTGGQVMVKVMTEVGVEKAEIGVVDRDQNTLTKPIKCRVPSKLGQLLEADSHQRVLMTFSLVDGGLAAHRTSSPSSPPLTAHQVFVRFTLTQPDQSKQTGQTGGNREIIFIAEPDADTGVYRFDMDVGEHGNEFSHVSGRYSMSLLVGDAVISNPLLWHVADLHLSHTSSPHHTSANRDPHLYTARPRIDHVFQVAEQRPKAWLSNMFSVIVAVVPLLIMLLLWGKIGVNLSNFTFSLSTVGFYIGLAGIFTLYYMFWTQLTMFSTLRYLLVIGAVTFVCGKNMLSNIAQRRESSGKEK